MSETIATTHLMDETEAVLALLGALPWDEARSERVFAAAAERIRNIRARKAGISEMETFLQHYPLASAEGLSLMTLAEALLRVPDAATADALIAEKIEAARWDGSGKSENGLFKLAGVGMGLARGVLGSFLGGIGKPVVRRGMEEAVRRIGQQFVLGRTIAEAQQNAKAWEKKGFRLSYDMLGEGARTTQDAERYFKAYCEAARSVADVAGHQELLHKRPGMSVKLSALHPRYVWTQEETCVPELIDRLVYICRIAAKHNIAVTVDAEEADRLDVSLRIIDGVSCHPDLKGWNGFGLAVQAYDKRCPAVLDYLAEMARRDDRILQVRLVKGAYWDTEIKRAQAAGLKDYPVFTRKNHTDISYLFCAHKLLQNRAVFYPMFATHNAVTVESVLDMAGGDKTGFEFQRLHGMGEALGDLLAEDGTIPVSIYAPVGSYEDLLPYLVRRMLENGASVSFVNKIRDEHIPPEDLARDPVAFTKIAEITRAFAIPLPEDLYGAGRINSLAPDLSLSKPRAEFLGQVAATPPFRGGKTTTDLEKIDGIVAAAKAAFPAWAQAPASMRAGILLRMANVLESHMPQLVALLQSEAKRTLMDSVSEVREAADFCRYYAAEGSRLFADDGTKLPGPTGENNRLILGGRGVFVCISPWNFPLAIFMGQIAAALMAGNTVLAKPAEQTPHIAAYTLDLLHKAGLPQDVLLLVPGAGDVGAALVTHPDIAGVAFTGSTEVARTINRALAAKDGPIVPLIAETGGQNAMIVDSTALLEQVVDDVISSAFGSAGQRCSALRVLYVQDDIAPRFLELLRGAINQMRVGDPSDPATDVGPVIDADALETLTCHKKYLDGFARVIGEADLPHGLTGTYFAPCAYEIDSIKRLSREVFGPILHVIRYAARDLDRVIADINSTGYGLTFGLHSRLEGRFAVISQKIDAGNIYINRSMIGAVVGVQPFGGQGLSGTGPKAGGPHYLPRFAHEKTISINTTATGGNVQLIAQGEG
jgi:RHH-type proline utilization regulon transcriptional repressor/proline dehydrogenase/delta 1-pyrroline-5-carboxylate dehydrogenase